MKTQPRSTSTAWFLGAAVIAVAALIAYVPALGAGFVFDDHGLVENSDLLKGPLSRIWFSADAPDYWPLTWTSFWVERRLWGTAPFGYHLVNVALHALTSVLLWRALKRLSLPGAWFAGLLFAVHPVAVESVAWVSERKNTLSGALFVAAILAFARWRDDRRRGDYAAALGLFVAAVLAKGSVVMLPVVLVGILVARGCRSWRELLPTVPFFGVAVLGGAVTVWFQWYMAIPRFMVAPRGLLERIGGAGWALATYLETAFVPVRLAFFYPPWPVLPSSPLFFLPLVALALIAAALWALRAKGTTPLLWALGYHAVLVAPVLGFVDMVYFRFAPVSNHLQYLALIGPVALIAAWSARLARRVRQDQRRHAVTALAAVVALALAGQTIRRAAAFQDDVTLFQAATREAPEALVAWWELSDMLRKEGRLDEAFDVRVRATDAVRDPASRLQARALLHLARVEIPQAVDAVNEAERIRPDPGFVRDVAMQLVLGGELRQGLRLLEPAKQRYPRYVDFHYWIAAALAREKRIPEATAILREAAAISPRDEQIRTALEVVEANARGR